MKKIIVSFLAFCIGFFCANAETHFDDPDNVLYINEASGQCGGQVVLSIGLKNTMTISGFQFELLLPEGIEVDHSISYGEMTANAAFSDERGNPAKFLFSAEFPEPDNYRHLNVVCYSMDKTFFGNDGEVALITLSIDENIAGGAYTLMLNNAVVSHKSDVYRSTQDIIGKLTVKTKSIIGDANGDASVSIADVTKLVDYLVNGNAVGLDIFGADANQDGSVTKEDIAALVNILLEK